MHESGEVPETLIAADGREYCLWDVDHFYAGRVLLPSRMQDSIELCLYENIYEREAALKMGVAASNPVSIYATVGLTHLIDMAYRGQLKGYRLARGQAA